MVCGVPLLPPRRCAIGTPILPPHINSPPVPVRARTGSRTFYFKYTKHDYEECECTPNMRRAPPYAELIEVFFATLAPCPTAHIFPAYLVYRKQRGRRTALCETKILCASCTQIENANLFNNFEFVESSLGRDPSILLTRVGDGGFDLHHMRETLQETLSSPTNSILQLPRPTNDHRDYSRWPLAAISPGHGKSSASNILSLALTMPNVSVTRQRTPVLYLHSTVQHWWR